MKGLLKAKALADSKQKVPLRHRQHVRRLAPQQHTVGLDLIGLWVDFDVRQVIVVDQVFFCTVRQPLTTPICFFRPSDSGTPASNAAWLMKVRLVACSELP